MVEEQNAILIGDFVKSVQRICPGEDEVGDIAVTFGHATREIYVKEIKSVTEKFKAQPNLPAGLSEQITEKIREQETLKGELVSLLAKLNK